MFNLFIPFSDCCMSYLTLFSALLPLSVCLSACPSVSLYRNLAVYLQTCLLTVCLPQIDIQKMPLGKLSKKQIQSAYAVLTEALGEVEGDQDPMKLLDCSNRFFTLIPHDFGMKKPPLLDNPDIIKVHTHSSVTAV